LLAQLLALVIFVGIGIGGLVRFRKVAVPLKAAE